jgi:hypothetical protein
MDLYKVEIDPIRDRLITSENLMVYAGFDAHLLVLISAMQLQQIEIGILVHCLELGNLDQIGIACLQIDFVEVYK